MRNLTLGSTNQITGQFALANVRDLNFIEDVEINGIHMDDWTVFRILHEYMGGSIRSMEAGDRAGRFKNYFDSVSGESDLSTIPVYIREYSNIGIVDTSVTPAAAWARNNSRTFTSNFSATYLNTVVTTLTTAAEFDIGIGVAQAIGQLSDMPETIEGMISPNSIELIKSQLSKHKRYIVARVTMAIYLNCFYTWALFDASTPNTPTQVDTFEYQHLTLAQVGGAPVPCTRASVSMLQGLYSGAEQALEFGTLGNVIDMRNAHYEGDIVACGFRSVTICPRHIFQSLKQEAAATVQPRDISAAFGIYGTELGVFHIDETLIVRAPDWLSSFMYSHPDSAFWILQISYGAAHMRHRITPQLLNYTEWNSLPLGEGAISQVHRFVGNFMECNFYTHQVAESTQGFNNSYTLDKRYVFVPKQQQLLRSFLMAYPTTVIPGLNTVGAALAYYDAKALEVFPASSNTDLALAITQANASGQYSRTFREIGDPALRSKAYYKKLDEIEAARRSEGGPSVEQLSGYLFEAAQNLSSVLNLKKENLTEEQMSRARGKNDEERREDIEAKMEESLRNKMRAEFDDKLEKMQRESEARVKAEVQRILAANSSNLFVPASAPVEPVSTKSTDSDKKLDKIE